MLLKTSNRSFFSVSENVIIFSTLFAYNFHGNYVFTYGIYVIH